MNGRRAFSAHRLAPLAVALLVSACTTMSGLSGGSRYACQAPDGVACDSVSGTYANALRHNLPGQRAASPKPTEHDSVASSAAQTAPGFAPLATPLRSAPRILRLWFKPWEDADQDLYDQGYVYVQIDGGRWLVAHAQRAIRDAYRPVQPPSMVATPDAAPSQTQAPFPPIPLPQEDGP